MTFLCGSESEPPEFVNHRNKLVMRNRVFTYLYLCMYSHLSLTFHDSSDRPSLHLSLLLWTGISFLYSSFNLLLWWTFLCWVFQENVECLVVWWDFRERGGKKGKQKAGHNHFLHFLLVLSLFPVKGKNKRETILAGETHSPLGTLLEMLGIFLTRKPSLYSLVPGRKCSA